MGISILAQFDTIRALLTGGGNLVLNGTWNEIRLAGVTGQATAGSGVFTHTTRLIKITNDTNKAVFIDTANTLQIGAPIGQDYIAAGGFALYDITSNKSISGGEFVLPEGIFIFASTIDGAAATGNGLFVTTLYGKGE